MATAQEARKGTNVKIDGEYFTVVDFTHIKLGRGGAFVRLKIKNIQTEAVLEKTFNPDAKIEFIRIEEKPMQYIYREGELYYFMDQETYEQISLNESILSNSKKYLKDNEPVHFLIIEEKVIGIKLPTFCEFKIKETEPQLKGARISGGLKPAVLETGAPVQVPLFIEAGDIVRVDTRTGEYIERVQ